MLAIFYKLLNIYAPSYKPNNYTNIFKTLNL